MVSFVLFSLGFGLGVISMYKMGEYVLKKREPLLANAFASVIKKTIDEGLSEEEVKELLEEELKFLRQILPEVN